MIDCIKIIGKSYTVRSDSEMLEGGEWGTCNHKRQEILFAHGQHPDQLRDTILHECIHAIDHGIKLDLEERHVHALACAIIALMRENPQLLSWMFLEDD